MNNLVYKKIKKNLSQNATSIVGVHGPQGIGKTTLSNYLCDKFSNKSYKIVVFSMDQFYYPTEELNKILTSFNDPIYKFRGLSGTHDVDLMYNCIQKLINGETTYIPTYDKSLNKGLGDRSGYIKIDFKPDIIVVEGWMLAYKPLKDVPLHLNLFNKNLEKYKMIRDLINIWIILESSEISNILKWRYASEPNNGMSFDKFLLFMEPYIKVYEAYHIDFDEKIILDINKNIIS